MTSALKQLHLFVEGRVQGVGFRFHTQHQAQHLGVTGWVRNCSDGRVEIVAQGESSALNTFKLWCEKGPAHAQVTRLSVETETPDAAYPTFEIRR